MATWLKAFFAGLLIGSAFRSLEQDIVGKEAYLKIVDAGWISAWITVPVAILWLTIGLILLIKAQE